MDISMNAGYLYGTREKSRRRTPDECVRLCTEAGFRVLDCSVDAWSDAWEAEANAFAEAAAKYGAVIRQSHAPYNFYLKRPPEEFRRALERSADAAVLMGVKDLVFHADEYHPKTGEPFDPAAAHEAAYSALAPCVERLIARGVRAAMETVFDGRGSGIPIEQRSHFCAEAEELLGIIDRFGDPMVGCCWDFGHAKLAFGNEKHPDVIRSFGKRITCTHVHDNYYRNDLHLPPFTGDANWEELMPAFGDIGYEGDLTFELVYGCLPDEQVPPFLSQLHRTGEILVGMIEKR